ncbi:MAG TPA: hypothetical protein VM754_03265 [Actinomycetota bacterium]|nr:hypothetical protein [Actinomycetota bacterium]
MKRHSMDAVSLVFGLFFVGLGGAYLVGYGVTEVVVRFWPAALIALGLAILLTPRRTRQAAPAAAPAAVPGSAPAGSPSVSPAAPPGEQAPASPAPPAPSASQAAPPPPSAGPPA